MEIIMSMLGDSLGPSIMGQLTKAKMMRRKWLILLLSTSSQCHVAINQWQIQIRHQHCFAIKSDPWNSRQHSIRITAVEMDPFLRDLLDEEAMGDGDGHEEEEGIAPETQSDREFVAPDSEVEEELVK